MGNALTTYMANAKLPSLSNAKAVAEAMDAADDDLYSGGDGVQYLKFSGKSGRWTIGQDNKEPEGLFAFFLPAYGRGWVYWHNSSKKPLKTIEWSAFEPDKAVAFDDLPDMELEETEDTDGWSESRTAQFAQVDSEGRMAQLNINSASGVRALDALWHEIKARAKKDEPFIPLVELEEEEFESRGYKNFKPVFRVETWVTEEALEAFGNGDISKADLLAGKQPRKKRGK